MSFARALTLLPLGFLCASLAGQDPAPRPADGPPAMKGGTARSLALALRPPFDPHVMPGQSPGTTPAHAADQKVEPAAAKADDSCEHRHCGFRHRRFRPRHHGHHAPTGHSPRAFGAYVQGVRPLRELKEDLDQRTGYGLGLQWTHDHGDWHASRTRLEWNIFPEGGSGTRTYAKNYLLSWDHLFKLNKGSSQAYVVTGIGGSRWVLEHTTAGLRDAHGTTKLALTGGVGVQIARRLNLEARYVVSSINRTFDANTLQTSLGWQF